MRSSILALILCVMSSANSLPAEKQGHPYWSIDLDQAGVSGGRPRTIFLSHPESIVTATDKFVAVAFNVKEPGTNTAQLPTESRWRLTVAIFDAGSGKLSATCGPRIIGVWFDLSSTASGNFLLHLTSSPDTGNQVSEMLLLLSPSCVELKQVQLPHLDNSKHHSWRILQSPSRRTVLLVGEEKESNDYQLRGMDSLEMKSGWLEPKSGTPAIVAVSDKGLLGLVPTPGAAFFDDKPIADYYRTFDGPWRPLPFSDYTSFLSDDTLVGTTVSNRQPWKVSKTKVMAIRLDGTPIFSATVSGTGYNVSRISEIWISSDGEHFGFALDFSGAGWLWGNLDMGPEHRSVYVWSASHSEPCAKVKFKSWPDIPSLAFAPSGSWFAVLIQGSKLSVHPLP